MKHEQEKTWDMSRRLSRWASNDFGNKSNGVKKHHNFKMPDGRNYLAWCSKCKKSDFYEPYNFSPDTVESRCCNAKLMEENLKSA